MTTPNPLSARDFLAAVSTARPFIPEMHTDDCDDVDCVRCVPAPRIPLRGSARLDAKAAAEAEATHWRRLGMTPPVLSEGGDR